MTDTSGTSIPNAPVIAPSIEIVEAPIATQENKETPTPQVLVNATPIPESLKTALSEPEKEKTDKQIKTEPKKINKPWLFQPGQSGNPEGRPKRKTITEHMHDELDKILPSGISGKQNMARLLIQMAFGKRGKDGRTVIKQDKDILKEVLHYLDGLPKQRIESTGLDDGPLQVEIIEHKEKKDDS